MFEVALNLYPVILELATLLGLHVWEKMNTFIHKKVRAFMTLGSRHKGQAVQMLSEEVARAVLSM